MIRPARLEDFPAVYKAGDALRRRSAYSHIEIDRGCSLRTFAEACQAPRYHTMVALAPDGTVDGCLIGVVQPLWWGHARYATDLLFFAARGWDYIGLCRDFVSWARTVPRVLDITMGVSAGIEPERMAVVFKRCGLKPLGGLFVMDLRRAA